jgi:hypothetical protein
MSDSIVVQSSENQPVVFTQDELGWLPWLDPLPEAELTERHWAGLVDRSRAKSDYFRLLVRDPEVLEARTKTEGHLLQHGKRFAASRARARCGGDLALQWLYLLRVRAFAFRHRAFQAPRGCSALARRRGGRRSRRTLERRRQSFGRACRDTHCIRTGAHRGAAPRGSG